MSRFSYLFFSRAVFSVLAIASIQCSRETDNLSASVEDPLAPLSQDVSLDALHLALTEEQRASIEMEVVTPTKRTLQQQRGVFGEIIPIEESYAHVVTKLSGSVRQVFVRRGEVVQQNQPLAVIESPELRQAATSYIEALHHYDVATRRLMREERLYQQQVIAENVWVDASNQAKEKQLSCLFAEQKLYGLGVDQADVEKLEECLSHADPTSRVSLPQRAVPLYYLRAPLSGSILERDLSVGEWVEPQHPAFTVADLSSVWAQLAVPLSMMESIELGQSLLVRDLSSEEHTKGHIIYVSPSVNRENLTVNVLVELDNHSKKWRLGSSVEAMISFEDKQAPLTLPRAAIQRIEGQEVVFVEVEGGFVVKPVEVGVCDGHCVEILEGLCSEDRCAASNTFILKSQLVLGEEREEQQKEAAAASSGKGADND